jgi:hypothetical protein
MDADHVAASDHGLAGAEPGGRENTWHDMGQPLREAGRGTKPGALASQVRGHLPGDDSVVDLSLGLGVVRGTPAPYHRQQEL